MSQDKLGRRKFVSSLGVLGIAGLCPAVTWASSLHSQQQPNAVVKTGAYLQAPSPGAITVRWITQVPCHGWIEYGLSADQLTNKAFASENGLVQAYNTIHAITLSDLQPGRKYFYRLHSRTFTTFEPYHIVYGDTHVSDVQAFEVPLANPETVSFLVFNDIHDRPHSFAHLMQFAPQQRPDFVLLNGDMFNYQTDEDQLVNHLLQPLTDLFATTTPFIFSRGNHEARGKFARQLPAYFNGPGQDFYFSFQYGPMYAIVLDSGEDKVDDSAEYFGLADFDRYREQQARWLEKEVQKKAFRAARYKVVFSHIPLYYSGDWHGPMHCRQVWGAILNKAKIDLMISGHTHRYGIHQPVAGEHHYPIVIGGGPVEGKRTIISVKADKKALNVQMKDDNGAVVGTLTI